MPAENLSRAFDRFWQATKTSRRGAGLGLAIVRGIVEAHGGRVWLDSTVGRGTTAFFTIPTAPSGEDWRPEEAVEQPLLRFTLFVTVTSRSMPRARA